MKIFKHIILISIISTNILALANSSVEQKLAENPKSVEYYPDYYDKEGDLLFKFQILYAKNNNKNKNLPASTNSGVKKPSNSLLNNGLGFDTSTSFFFTDNFATELSLGFIYHKVKRSVITEVFRSYGQGTPPGDKRKNIYVIPGMLTLQYHIAPYGGIRPYIGAGYHGTYMHSRSKQYKLSHGHGPVLEGGIYLIARDDTVVSLNVRKLLLESKVTYRSTFLNTTDDISSKVKFNPLIISLGYGFKL